MTVVAEVVVFFLKNPDFFLPFVVTEMVVAVISGAEVKVLAKVAVSVMSAVVEVLDENEADVFSEFG